MHTVFIALGGNLTSLAGSPEATLAAAALRLQSIGRVLSRSSLYSTEPVGFSEQPRFLNAVVALETQLSPRALLSALLAIELEFGRDRSAGIANGPRTLDLDILLYDDLILDEPDLQIPHPRLGERAFVLVPLAEIAPEAIEPHSKSTVAELLHRLGEESPCQSAAVIPVLGLLWARQDPPRVPPHR
jgi:2-amino-4-hydroxy-6-hydroxymethyldihydropteridine diphosphokinase